MHKKPLKEEKFVPTMALVVAICDELTIWASIGASATQRPVPVRTHDMCT
jgi:hypothetical protein